MSDLNWLAIYNDGTCLRECNLDGSFNNYYNIDRDKICTFNVYPGWFYPTLRTLFLVENGWDIKDALIPKELELNDKEKALYFQQISQRTSIPISTLSAIPQMAKFPPIENLHYPKAPMTVEKKSFLLSLDLNDNRKRLIWRKRRWQRATEGKPFATTYLIGWQMTLNDENIQSIVYIYPNGQLELSDGKSDLELFPEEVGDGFKKEVKLSVGKKNIAISPGEAPDTRHETS